MKNRVKSYDRIKDYIIWCYNKNYLYLMNVNLGLIRFNSFFYLYVILYFGYYL